MKKKLAALLCGVMCVGAFSGCSTDELGYLKMAANAMDTMKTCEVKGTMQADINFDDRCCKSNRCGYGCDSWGIP